MPVSNPVVVGVDFSSCSRAAMLRAARFAKALGAPLRVVHALDVDVLSALAAAMGDPPAAVGSERVAEASARLYEFAQGVAEPDDCVVRVGSPADELLAEAASCGAPLIVVGVYGAYGPALGGVGSFASHIVRHAPCETALVAETDAEDAREIVVGTDFSPTCARAVRFAARIAVATDARLHLVHVLAPPWKQHHYRAPTPEASAPYRTHLEATLRASLAACAAEVSGAARVETALIEAPSHGAGLADYVRRVGARLVVVGKRGRRSALAQFVFGSTAERLLRNLPASLVAVQPVAT
jgi:nucleotide-binding universal stress UspA family protein